MNDRHCPFLNRDDRRCNEHLRVDQLRHALSRCADDYAACPSYRVLLAERIMRRNAESALRPISLTLKGHPYAAERCRPSVVVRSIDTCPRWSFTEAGLVAA